MDDSELIARAKTDKEAFGALYERYVDRIYSYVYYRIGNVQDAEDLTARIFYRAMQHIGRYEDKGIPFSAWLYRIARNLLANWYRDQSRRHIISLDDIMHWRLSEDTPELSAQLTEDRNALLEAVRHLPTERQELLILKFVDRLSNAEIGAIMGRSEGAIKSLYHRTLLSLRDEMHGSTAGEQRKSRFWLSRFTGTQF
ncbi:MAG: sigma-70 family RNA polymerase sigma factor [Anaerolineae bacterium]|nr:sigma-70 family RNA polymerase sigma factor [Anaerolineae bacterium]MCO5187939.1 sigma-70 family RNA polymerase sigma factor [Anaerolineae bacterium]MCO5195054.1 sigma-70 family RNA polymerase sigma factor [Anaerolineae bacterium]MCO5196414.1 sigma-70 family RNA polymerase sigma factor [Anaerolineae bacterium]MCO5207181.1 sigma-70 family RNA polymerase sigma factor [Anaerolineae bacterium]